MKTWKKLISILVATSVLAGGLIVSFEASAALPLNKAHKVTVRGIS
jgi:hypothetical protein